MNSNSFPFEFAEMDINTAAKLLDVGVATMSSDPGNQIIGLLHDDESAINQIALQVANFEKSLGRPVTLMEAAYGLNPGGKLY